MDWTPTIKLTYISIAIIVVFIRVAYVKYDSGQTEDGATVIGVLIGAMLLTILYTFVEATMQVLRHLQWVP